MNFDYPSFNPSARVTLEGPWSRRFSLFLDERVGLMLGRVYSTSTVRGRIDLSGVLSGFYVEPYAHVTVSSPETGALTPTAASTDAITGTDPVRGEETWPYEVGGGVGSGLQISRVVRIDGMVGVRGHSLTGPGFDSQLYGTFILDPRSRRM